jgi:UDP-glucose 4-epimerase
MKVLVLGANGFLGRHLAQICAGFGWEVDVVFHTSKSHLSLASGRVLPVEELEKLSDVHYSYIFNSAAFIPYGAYDKADERLLESNIELVLRAHKTFPKSKMILASSVSVYGSNEGVLTEKSSCLNPTAYGLSKLASEMITAHHSQYSILRFSSLYGRGMFSGTFVPKIIDGAKNKKLITLLGLGERKQNYLHVRDAAQYCVQAALNGTNEIYLGVDHRSYRNAEVAEYVAQNVAGCKIAYDGKDNSPSFEYDHSYTAEKLKFKPQTSLAEGIKELIHE